MAVVMISKGSYSRGKEVAEAVAAQLGYACIEREMLLKECSAKYKVAEVELSRALYDAPVFWEQVAGGKEKYETYIRAGLLHRLRDDDIVYHGMAAHYLVAGVDHVLKVRIIADMKYRAAVVAKRDGVDESTAAETVRRGDQKRSDWSRGMWGIAVTDPALYDQVLRIDHLTAADAVETICLLAQRDTFRTTPESARRMEDLVIAADVRVALVEAAPDATVSCSKGRVSISIRAGADAGLVEELATSVAGIVGVEVETRA